MIARRLMYLPAALLLTWGLLAAAGISLTADSRAATATTDIGATVLPNLTLGGTCTTGPATTRSITPGGGATALLDASTCTVTHSTNNNPAGTILRVESERPSGATFCKNSDTTIACGAVAAFTDTTPSGGAASLATGGFGVRVAGAPTCSSATWVNATYYPVRDAATAPGTGDTVCSHAGLTTATNTLSFEASAAAAQESGLYYAAAVFSLAAN